MTRTFDILLSALILMVSAPLIFIGIIGILLTSPGNVFFFAPRAGLSGKEFKMLKLRTMHVKSADISAITAPNDARVFKWGWFLRNSKIDELPQLLNILIGDMSFVGPRPEDPHIVRVHYADWMMSSLDIRPGITSPGTLFGYKNGDRYLCEDNVEESYARELLPRKLKIDIEYFETATFISNFGVILQTACTILVKAFSSLSPKPHKHGN